MKISFQDASCTVFESELMQTTCTLIQRPNHLLLVDPNWLPSEVEAIAEEVARVQAGRPLYLLFTHSDYDHIIAYERFREDASLIVSRALLENCNCRKFASFTISITCGHPGRLHTRRKQLW